jgi:hypothetical protein
MQTRKKNKIKRQKNSNKMDGLVKATPDHSNGAEFKTALVEEMLKDVDLSILQNKNPQK